MAKCGRECEVFSRVVGYFRPTKFWNRGKQEEFRQRKEYEIPTQDRIEAAKKVVGAEDQKVIK
jgi:hypothetical protein